MSNIKSYQYKATERDLIILEAYQHPVDFAHWVAYSNFIQHNPKLADGWVCEPSYEALREENTVCSVKLFTSIMLRNTTNSNENSGNNTINFDIDFIGCKDITIDLIDFPLKFVSRTSGEVIIHKITMSYIVDVIIPLGDYTEAMKDVNYTASQMDRSSWTPVVITSLSSKEVFDTLKLVMFTSLMGTLLNIKDYQLKL